jgi:hypothetical protein
MRLEPLISHTGILMTFYLSIILDLQDVNTICRRSWYIAAHVWKIYDFKIEVGPFIINFSTELTTVVKNDADEAVSVVSLTSSSTHMSQSFFKSL